MLRTLRPLVFLMLAAAVVAIAFFTVSASAQETPAATGIALPAETNIVDATLAVGRFVTYQGVLLDPANNPRPSGTYNMTFRLYKNDPVNGPIEWQETQNVIVADGYFSVRLGSSNPLNPGSFVNNQLFLGIQVAGDTEMRPRQALTGVPYAMNSLRLEQLRAYGIVEANGTAGNGHRFSSSIQQVGGINSYVIDISENYNSDNFVTTITPIYNSTCPFGVMASSGSGGGRLIVDLFNVDGGRVYCRFSFSVLALN